MLHVSVRTVEGWEQGRRAPEGPAMAYIALYDKVRRRAPDALIN